MQGCLAEKEKGSNEGEDSAEMNALQKERM